MKRNDIDSDQNESNKEIKGYDRRSFMAVAGVAGGFGAFARGSGVGVNDLGGRFAKSDTASDDTGSEGDDAGLPTGTSALLGYVEARYGDRLSEEELQSIEADIAADLEAAAAIDAVPLQNSDAPAFDFAVYRGGE